MTCHECGSEEHLVRHCPRRRAAGTSLFVESAEEQLSTPTITEAGPDEPARVFFAENMNMSVHNRSADADVDPIQSHDPWFRAPSQARAPQRSEEAWVPSRWEGYTPTTAPAAVTRAEDPPETPGASSSS